MKSWMMLGIFVAIVIDGYTYWVAENQWVEVKVVSLDQRITRHETNRFLLSMYATFTLNAKREGMMISENLGPMERMYPQLITIILSDKKRLEYPRIAGTETVMSPCHNFSI